MSEKPSYEELEQRIKVLEKKLANQDPTRERNLKRPKKAEFPSQEEINVSGINIRWDIEKGECTFETLPVAMMWVDTTLAGLMSGVQSMVGKERFALALQAEGRNSVEADWQVISQFSKFEEGFEAIANIAAVAGWGEWKLISLDKARKECRFRIKGSWEGKYQKALGVSWGSGMLAGKLAGYVSRLFSTNCWAEQTMFIAKGDQFDEFVVVPSERTIEKEIESLLLTDDATKADMAVALQNLQKEIRERKRVEEEQKELQTILSNAIEMAHLGPWEYDITNDLFTFNDYFYKIFHTTAEEVGGYKMTSDEYARRFVHPDDMPQVKAETQKAIETDDPNFNRQVEHKIIYADGTVGHITVRFFIIKDESGKTIKTYGVNQDITEHKRAEERLRDSEEKYRTLFENMMNGFALHKILVNEKEDPVDYVFLETNAAFERLTGLKRKDLIGKKVTEALPGIETDPADWIGKYGKVALTGKESRFEQYSQNLEKSYSVHAFSPQKEQFAVIFEDITERKRMEEEILRSQKLESLGILAGGIAHDFNNILTTILGNVSIARDQVAPGSEIFELLGDAKLASKRAQALTRQLLTFAKGGTPVKETASIGDTIKESSLFILRGAKSGCGFFIAEDLWPVEVDVGQISQVINNIVINANQAMPEGGIIEISAENIILKKENELQLKPGRYIRISVKDQGTGIAKKHLSKIYDPYFTTKQDGSGLGLATVYSIIKKHGGIIMAKSLLVTGTTFHIYLPASEKAVSKKRADKIIKGRGRILVMDDEESLRKVVGALLKKLGYEPGFAKDGKETIRMVKKAKKSKKPYDAVILDLTVPGGMGGKEAIKKLLKIDPEINAIVSSGYSDDPVLANFQEYGFKGIIPKPFETLSLSKVLHEVLKGEKV